VAQFGVDARDTVSVPGSDMHHGDLVRERVVDCLPGTAGGSPSRQAQ
jgi:hypothetical protein